MMSDVPTSTRARVPLSAIATFVVATLLAPMVIFLAAGTLRWPMGWVYWGFSAAATVLSRALAARVHPDLLAERAQSQRAQGVKPWDRSLSVVVGLLAPFASLIVIGLDKRWSWSPPLPLWVAAMGLVLLVLGYALGTWALVTNRFFSGVVRIQTERGHHVVTDGPYRLMRHPGYAGGTMAAVATPLLLGSLWGLISAAVYVAFIVVRTALEDRTLNQELPGYRAYAQRTRYRLLPGVW
jgi:protein-S-isoprenylcysteine O-methyltransferase Ste14